jgi:hypothetical protein
MKCSKEISGLEPTEQMWGGFAGKGSTMSTTQSRRPESQIISVQIPLWLRVELEALAARNDRSFSAEVRVALNEHVSSSMKKG